MHASTRRPFLARHHFDPAAPAASLQPARPWWLDPHHQLLLTWGFVILGVAARTVRYLLRFPLWDDECFLVVNLIDRGFTDLAGPLDYHQVAPLLFLWCELAAVKLLGFSELPLRLFSFCSSIASLLLFHRLSGKLCNGMARVMAVAIFAVAYSGIRYAAEAKPYAVDQLVSLVLLTLAVAWYHERRSLRWPLALAAVLPLCIGLSYPAVFMAGGISLVAAALLWREWSRTGCIAWLGYNAVLVASFAGFYAVAAQHQSSAELEWMRTFWHRAFPPLDQPLKLPGWLLVTHTSDLLAFPAGGARGASTLSFLCCLAGLVQLWRSRRYAFSGLCLAPLALHFAAAALHRYPYGGHVKFSQYLAPLIALVAGLGASWLITAVRGRSPRAAPVVLLVLAGIAVASIGRDFRTPYKSPNDLRARDFARWFWRSTQFQGESVCLKTDLNQVFSPETFRELGWSAMYLCNQRIYSPRHARGEPPRLDLVSPERPLRCVQFRSSGFAYDEAALARWLARMQARYSLVSRDTFPFPWYDKRERRLLTVDYVDVYKFVPRGP